MVVKRAISPNVFASFPVYDAYTEYKPVFFLPYRGCCFFVGRPMNKFCSLFEKPVWKGKTLMRLFCEIFF